MSENPITKSDYSSRPDEDLAELCKTKDDEAFKELMRRYLKPIYNFSHQYGKTPEDAEDIAQDTFFKVWKYIGKYHKGRSFRPWLYTIARNTALDHIKKKKALSFTDLDDPNNELSFVDTLEDNGPLPSEIFETSMEVSRLTIALKDLHPDHQAILTLHYKEELTFDEIAGIVGRPMNTVKSWHRRALIRLRQIMAEPKPKAERERQTMI